MAYVSDHPLFSSLTDDDEAEFRKWAQENDPPNMDQWDAYHPVCRDEWTKRGIGPIAMGERL